MPYARNERQALEEERDELLAQIATGPARARDDDGSGPDSAGVPRVADQGAQSRIALIETRLAQDRGSVTTRAQLAGRRLEDVPRLSAARLIRQHKRDAP